LKVFVQPGCPACPSAERLAEKLKEKTKVEIYDISQRKALKEAIKYRVMATPTLVLTDQKGKIKKQWVGTPEEKEILKHLGE